MKQGIVDGSQPESCMGGGCSLASSARTQGVRCFDAYDSLCRGWDFATCQPLRRSMTVPA